MSVESATRTKPVKSHCVHGHEMSPVNQYRDAKGNVSCKTCRREKTAARNEEIRERRAEEARALRFIREYGTTPDVEHFKRVVAARAERLSKKSSK